MMIPEYISRKPIIWELRKFALYSITSVKMLVRIRKFSLLRDSLTYFPLWWKYKRKVDTPLKYDCPWIVFKAEEFLRENLKKDMIVFEYGSGSSTLYFSRRVARVISIEHERQWFDKLSMEIAGRRISNIDYHLFEAERADAADDFLSSSPLYKDKSFAKYVRSIDQYPDNSFDIVFVDGRSRANCIAHARNKVKAGGFLILDNSDREHYFDGNDFLRDHRAWEAHHFIGPIPYSFEFSKTSFFKKL